MTPLPYDQAVVTRGDRTRERLLDVAEELFGEHGIRNVSLRQIRLAAAQGNAAVVQYHFGNREGVITALVARHGPRLLARQAELIAEFADAPVGALGPVELRQLVAAFVRPFADYVATGPSERAFIKIAAELTSNPRISLDTLTAHTDEQAVRIGGRLFDELSRRMPPELASERVFAAYQFAIHVCANRAKVRDSPRAERGLSGDETFAENLVDMCTGALTAPVHGQAL